MKFRVSIIIFIKCYYIANIKYIKRTVKFKHNKHWRIPKVQSKLDNSEKLATQKHTRGRKTKQTHNSICAGHHHTQTNSYSLILRCWGWWDHESYFRV